MQGLVGVQRGGVVSAASGPGRLVPARRPPSAARPGRPAAPRCRGRQPQRGQDRQADLAGPAEQQHPAEPPGVPGRPAAARLHPASLQHLPPGRPPSDVGPLAPAQAQPPAQVGRNTRTGRAGRPRRATRPAPGTSRRRRCRGAWRPWPGRPGRPPRRPAVQVVQQRAEPRVARGHVDRERPAGHREGQMAPGPGPEPLQRAQERGAAMPLHRLQDLGDDASRAPSGTTNWYCTKPRGPSARFQPSTRVQPVEEGGRSATPLSSWGALRNHSLLNSARGPGVNGQNGTAGARRARCGRYARPSGSAPRVRAGQVVADVQDAAAEGPAGRGGVDPRHRVPGPALVQRGQQRVQIGQAAGLTCICALRTRSSRIVAPRMMPVRPIPPTVARNASGSPPGVSRRSSPVPSRSSISSIHRRCCRRCAGSCRARPRPPRRRR